MKKSFKTILALSMSLTMLISCGGADSSESTEKSGDSSTEVQDEIQDAPVEEVVYEPFTIEKLNGTWKAVDAKAYSKNEIIGQIFSFNDTTATFYASYGEGGMINGELSIEGDELNLIDTKTDPVSGSKTTMTTTYTGGFVGNELHLISINEIITLTKQ